MFDSNHLEELNLREFSVVKSEMFCISKEMSMTLFPDRISFNKESHAALNNCDCVQILISRKDMKIIVSPSSSHDGDVLLWKMKKNAVSNKHHLCKGLTQQLYTSWELNEDCRYRTIGRIIQIEKKIMLLFDFADSIAYTGKKSLVQQ